jgi:hypothetical protein
VKRSWQTLKAKTMDLLTFQQCARFLLPRSLTIEVWDSCSGRLHLVSWGKFLFRSWCNKTVFYSVRFPRFLIPNLEMLFSISFVKISLHC